MSVESQ